MKEVYLALGSNLGDKKALLDKAIEMIAEEVGTVFKCSSYFETEPWGFESTETFINMAIGVHTLLNADIVLQKCLQIETSLGRERKETTGYSSRTMDIDILLYNSEIINDSTLIVPHPEMLKRNFVMLPLNEIAGRIKHPITGKDIAEHSMKFMSDQAAVKLG